MYFVRIIDENGLFVREEVVDELTDLTIEVTCPDGFYRPKWDGSQWIEGLTQAEIDALKVVPVVEPTIEDRNRADIDYISAMLEVSLDV